LKYADSIVFMKEGAIVYEHKISEELPLKIINEVFGLEATLVSIPGQQRKLIVF